MSISKLDSNTVWKVLQDNRSHGEVARDLGMNLSTVSRIRAGRMQKKLYDLYCQQVGKPAYQKARRGGISRDDIYWLYRTDGEVSSREASCRLSLTEDSVKKIRQGLYYHSQWRDYHNRQKGTISGYARQIAITKPWGPATRGPAWGPVGRLAL